MSEDFTFEGWQRPDGGIGIRNHCLVLATYSASQAWSEKWSGACRLR
jgi:altronate dehydratase